MAFEARVVSQTGTLPVGAALRARYLLNNNAPLSCVAAPDLDELAVVCAWHGRAVHARLVRIYSTAGFDDRAHQRSTE
jgi:hypothetical protein